MKTIKFFIIIILSTFLINCNDNFLERYPATSISADLFFRSPDDLELYTNTFYGYIINNDFQTSPIQDYVSDNNVTYLDNHERNSLLRGNITPSTVSGWNSWHRLRAINYMLENVQHVKGDQGLIDHYIGIARFFRALWYYDMVKRYSDVPWYSKSLTDSDEEMLFKEQDPRSLVVDSIMSDLNYACTHIKSTGNSTQISKWFALAMKARICLHEGTFRKYHKELNLQSSSDFFITEAKEASEEIMQSGQFDIDMNGGPEKAYKNLFNSQDLSSSNEMILYKDHDYEMGVSLIVYGQDFTSLSRSLMESYEYLSGDGKAMPFSTVENYDKKTFIEVFENRDPRLRQTFAYPGFKTEGDSYSWRPDIEVGGYRQIKFTTESTDPAKAKEYFDYPVFRYAEVLLIYAEAKAELNQLTQEDVNKTLNIIRNRVGMPSIIIENLIIDPNLVKQYPGISDPILREIRRERRIEFACENFRWDDLIRWGAANLLREPQEGLYIEKFGGYDFDGDGKIDVALFEDRSKNTLSDEELKIVTVYYLNNTDGTPNIFKLTQEDSGFIINREELKSRKFEEPKFYYFPIPETHLFINPNLKQTNFW